MKRKVSDAWGILGLEKGASVTEIKKAYRSLSKKYHPDRHDIKDAEKYTELMKDLNWAYRVLKSGRYSDPEQIKNAGIIYDIHSIIRDLIHGKLKFDWPHIIRSKDMKFVQISDNFSNDYTFLEYEAKIDPSEYILWPASLGAKNTSILKKYMKGKLYFYAMAGINLNKPVAEMELEVYADIDVPEIRDKDYDVLLSKGYRYDPRQDGWIPAVKGRY